MEKVVKEYEEACNKLIEAFCEKQEIEFDGWIGDEVGGIAGFATQYFFNVSDIVFDLKTNQPKGLILSWQNDDVDFNMFNSEPKHINYQSYARGLRHFPNPSK